MTKLSFGPFAVVVRCPASGYHDLAGRAYSEFIRSPEASPASFARVPAREWAVDVRIAGSLPASFQSLQEVDKNPVPIRRRSGRLFMDGGWFRATVDVSGQSATLECPMSLHPLDSLLRVLYTVTGSTAASFLLHAAAVVVRNRAYAVFGPSGAGKSTIAAAATSGGDYAIGDELVGLEAGDGGPVAHGTPFWDGRSVSLPLAALVVPVKAQATSVDALESGDALRLMWPHVQVAGLDSQGVAAMLRAAGEIADRVPALRLEFALGAKMWEEIRDALVVAAP